MENREQLLLRLVHFERPLSIILSELGKYEWDSDRELICLSTTEVEKAIRLFMNGGASSDEIVEWANALEGRDDIGCSEEVKQVIYQLANPELEGPLTNEKSLSLIKTLHETSNAS